MRLPLLALVLVACKTPQLDVDPVSSAEATEVAERYAAAVAPCNEATLGPLIDEEAIAAKFAQQSKALGISLAAQQMVDQAQGVHSLCIGNKTAFAAKLLRVRTVDGQPRPLLRRLMKAPRSGATMVGYDELQLGKSRRDHKVRVIDVYFQAAGQWLTEAMSGVTNAVLDATDSLGAIDLANSLRKASTLHEGGSNVEALAILDGLPTSVRQTKPVQIMRVTISLAISREAYGRALADVAHMFPGDPTIALLEIDGAILRGDYDAALRNVDTVDAAVGGDPFQDSVRAKILQMRNAPGDLEKASERLETAIRTEPSLKALWETKLDIEVARQRWPEAVATLDMLRRTFRVVFDETKLRAIPGHYGELLDSPEYIAWRAKQQVE